MVVDLSRRPARQVTMAVTAALIEEHTWQTWKTLTAPQREEAIVSMLRRYWQEQFPVSDATGSAEDEQQGSVVSLMPYTASPQQNANSTVVGVLSMEVAKRLAIEWDWQGLRVLLEKSPELKHLDTQVAIAVTQLRHSRVAKAWLANVYGAAWQEELLLMAWYVALVQHGNVQGYPLQSTFARRLKNVAELEDVATRWKPRHRFFLLEHIQHLFAVVWILPHYREKFFAAGLKEMHKGLGCPHRVFKAVLPAANGFVASAATPWAKSALSREPWVISSAAVGVAESEVGGLPLLERR